MDPDRVRKLLLHREEIGRLSRKTQEKGLTLVPLEVYFRNGKAKVTLGLARGRRLYDKREKLRKKTQEMEARRAMRKHR